MSRNPPAITAIYMQSDGSLHLDWDLDRFFDDPDEPDEVWVQLAVGIVGEVMPGDTRSFDIPATVITALGATTAVTGSVVFKWNGPPDDTKGSAFIYPLAGGVPGHQGEVPTVPTVALVSREPKTLRRANQITISWGSYSYTRGTIIWGPPGNTQRFTHRIDPRGAVYSGQFTTDQPLAPRTDYQFLVQVTNALQGNRTVGTAITVGSAANFSSVRQFLAASGVTPGTGLRGLLSGSQSLRALLGV